MRKVDHLKTSRIKQAFSRLHPPFHSNFQDDAHFPNTLAAASMKFTNSSFDLTNGSDKHINNKTTQIESELFMK